MTPAPGPGSGGGPEPRLGVGICALNEARALPRLLARLVQQRDPADRADRIVVADGGSTDGTQALARRFGAEVLEGARGRGAQLARAGTALAGGGATADVLLFLHADCVPRHGAIAAVRRAFARGVRAAALRQEIEGEGRFLRWVERAANARARRGMAYGDSGMALDRALYLDAGGYPDIPLFEDVALSKAVRRAGERVRLVEDATLVISPRRWEDEGALRCTLRNWMLRGLYEVGVGPARLARLYRPHAPDEPSHADDAEST